MRAPMVGNAKPALWAMMVLLAVVAGCSDGGDGGTSPVEVATVHVAPRDGVWNGMLKVGQSVALAAKAVASNGSELPGRTAAWTSTDTAVAVVSSGGVVVARGEGAAEVRASISGRTGRMTVVVTADAPPPAPVVAEVRVTPAAVVLALGQTQQYQARAFDAAGDEVFGRAVTWTTSTPQTISLTATGLARALAPGYGEVRATIDGRWGSVALTVATPEPVRAVRVEPGRIAVFTTQTTRLQATVLGPDNGPLPGRPVTWESENTAIATVGTQGMVLGVSKGTVRIRATSGGVTGWATVEVRNLPTTSRQTYDLIGTADWPTGFIQIGEDTWTDPGGAVRDVLVIVRGQGSTMKIDLDAGTYIQTWTIELYLRNGQPNAPPIHTKTVIDQGRFLLAVPGLPILESTTTPGAVYPIAAAGTGEYMIPQSVLGSWTYPWMWVIR